MNSGLSGLSQSDMAEIFRAGGLTLFGMVPAVRDSAAAAAYGDWIDRGFHGTMEYLQRHRTLKYDPAALLPGCTAILCAGLNYYQDPGTTDRADCGIVARYAAGRDYHKVLKNRLRHIQSRLELLAPSAAWRSFTDTAPLDERFYAERAGIGFRGRSTLLISGSFGSWFLLGEILTTLPFPDPAPAAPGNGATEEPGVPGSGRLKCPPGCSRCIRSCPTGALRGPGELDASRCISYLTIEHRGTIEAELAGRMGNRVFGCDRCQEVCPMNAGKPCTGEPDFLRHISGCSIPLEDLLTLSKDAFRARFSGSPLMRAGREGLVRNACIAAGNSHDAKFIPYLEALTRDPDAAVAAHAAIALRNLVPDSPEDPPAPHPCPGSS